MGIVLKYKHSTNGGTDYEKVEKNFIIGALRRYAFIWVYGVWRNVSSARTFL